MTAMIIQQAARHVAPPIYIVINLGITRHSKSLTNEVQFEIWETWSGNLVTSEHVVQALFETANTAVEWLRNLQEL